MHQIHGAAPTLRPDRRSKLERGPLREREFADEIARLMLGENTACRVWQNHPANDRAPRAHASMIDRMKWTENAEHFRIG